MYRSLRIISVLLINLFLFIPFSFAEYPGVTPGSFSVTDGGSASYSLPISTPAGIAGMSPDLAISYSSSGGNGIMGWDFKSVDFRLL